MTTAYTYPTRAVVTHRFDSGDILSFECETVQDVQSYPCDSSDCYDERWREACPNPDCLVIHAYRAPDGGGRFPTLDFVIDESFECFTCDNEPHTVIVRSHYVCTSCGVTVAPRCLPAFHDHRIMGPRSATLTVVRVEGRLLVTSRIVMTEDDLYRLMVVPADDRAEIVHDIMEVATVQGRLVHMEIRNFR